MQTTQHRRKGAPASANKVASLSLFLRLWSLKEHISFGGSEKRVCGRTNRACFHTTVCIMQNSCSTACNSLFVLRHPNVCSLEPLSQKRAKRSRCRSAEARPHAFLAAQHSSHIPPTPYRVEFGLERSVLCNTVPLLCLITATRLCLGNIKVHRIIVSFLPLTGHALNET